MNRIIEILMKRDGNTEKEAEARLDEVKNMLIECNYHADESEVIIMEQLGLEMDYLEDILF
ncbi:hypothetical protein DW886_17555 [Enterocloster aldenensis]|uniref:hypothetical protein n=1 Tax=Enterocloster aldenensis TaxID=358742 RepID=UPI000E4BBECA|nr:hypothetical protein DW886_17555 [Enterocloster aldenensis]